MATSPHSQLDVGVDGHEREQRVRRQLLITQDLFKSTIPSHAQMKGRTTQNSSQRNGMTIFTQNLHNPPYPHTIARQSTRAQGPIEEEHHRT